jgi:hypothetical protein
MQGSGGVDPSEWRFLLSGEADPTVHVEADEDGDSEAAVAAAAAHRNRKDPRGTSAARNTAMSCAAVLLCSHTQ